MSAKFALKKSGDQFMFNLVAGNGQTVLTSERYKQKASAVNGIESVRKNAPQDKRYDRRTSTSGKPYFVLKAGNGEIIGNSQMYSDSSAMENGINSVKENAPDALLDDQA